MAEGDKKVNSVDLPLDLTYSANPAGSQKFTWIVLSSALYIITSQCLINESCVPNNQFSASRCSNTDTYRKLGLFDQNWNTSGVYLVYIRSLNSNINRNTHLLRLISADFQIHSN